MLHRSFKPAKCKTALKLAVSRIKLLKNKREAQVKQLKRELAKLLESGQDQTARIRVEHVVREEKTMAAYDLIEIYCELIAARLPMIESQKNCPIDLKEAVSSVIFATPRCSDLPELMDVKKHITSKYGKEFVSAAVELRPDCGLVEKLSAKAPDGPTKIKILTAIAEEHNIKWEPKSFGENDAKSSQDLLVGPSTFEKASYAEPSQVYVPPVHDEEGPPNIRATSQRAGSQKMDVRDSYSENRSDVPVRRQNWNMEFKDAASAARAAAESAERASMAARAAAELSNRENITRQYSSGSHSSSGSGSRDEVPQAYVFHDDKHLSTGSVNSTLRRNSSQMHNEQNTDREQDNLVGTPNEYYRNSHEYVVKHAQSASLMPGSAFGEDRPFSSGSQMGDIYQHKNSFKQENSDLHEKSIQKQASRTKEDFVTELHGDGDLNTENNNYHFGETRTNREYRKTSSSHLSIPSDDDNDNLNLSGWEMGNKAVEDLFVTDEGNAQRHTVETSSYNDTSVVFDDSGSEDDAYKYDVDKKYKGEGSSLFFSSPGRKLQVDSPLENTYSWSHGQNSEDKETSSSTQSHFSVVSERVPKSAVSSEKEDLLPVTFDDSDDPGSDSEVNLVTSKVSGTFNYGNSVLDQIANPGVLGSSSRNDKNVGTDRKSSLSPSSVGSDTVEVDFERKVDATVSEKNFGYDNLPTSEPSTKGRSSLLGIDLKANTHALQSPDTNNDTETLEESRIESGKEFNYGTLKGGLRNKGYRRPPYIKNTSDDVSSSLGDISVQDERSLPTVRTSVSSNAPVQDKYTREVSRENRNVGLRAHNTSFDSDSYDLVANPQETLTSTHGPCFQKEQSVAKKKSSSRASVAYFDSENSDSEDELPKQNSASLARPVSGISRRTLASPKTGAGLSSKDAPVSKATVTSGTRLGWKSSRVSNESENLKASPTMKSSENWTGSRPGSAENKSSKPISEPNRSLDEDIMNSSARVQPSSSLPKTVIQEDTKQGQQASKSLNSDEDTLSKQRADHVHPKLPDYDSFAAHFLSLKKGRQ
ncbi:Vacuolar protein sorting-associated protein Ist1 [Sesbania bispinosa]|nr:Vacuolar protein sorting-associated protein Ist1 [Sesbania bispinosa]